MTRTTRTNRTVRLLVLPGVLASSLLAAALGQGVAAAAPAPAPAAGADTVFGSAVQQKPGELLPSALSRVEGQLGHLDVVRRFQTTPQPEVFKQLGGRSAIVSLRLPPDQVLAGTYDAQLRGFFAAAPTTQTTWWSYYHEPDVAYKSGALTDLQQYRDAFQHVAQIAENTGNTDLKTTVILFNYTANPKSGMHITDFWPGAAMTDVIAWDNYNGWATNQGTYGDPAPMIQAEKAASDAVGKPFGVAEFGSVVINNNYQGRANWITAASQAADSKGALFASYFNISGKTGGHYALLDAPSQNAYQAVVSDQNPF